MSTWQRIKNCFVASPLVCSAYCLAFWLLVRIVLQFHLPRGSEPFPLDFPLYRFSPIATELNMTFTAFWLGVAGVVLGIAALFRRREAWRWWAALAIGLNVAAYLGTVCVNSWALFPPPGVDY